MSTNYTQQVSIRELDAPFDRIEMEADFSGISPGELFSYWTEPEKLTLWWPQEAEVDARPDGSYQLSWPNMEWHLRGNYTTFRPGKMLVFTWRWDHEPHTPTRVVTLDFQSSDAGTTLQLIHGYYREHVLADKEEKRGHIEGWHYFLGRLQEVTEELTSASGA